MRRYEVFHVFDPFRIVIDIYPHEKTPAAAGIAPAKPAEPVGKGYTMARQLGLGVRTIVIDPGHGGADPGCIDPTALYEKDLTLDISLRLRDLLKANTGLSVLMTRETDIAVPLENRTVIANQRRADLFVSVHINAFPEASAEGGRDLLPQLQHRPGRQRPGRPGERHHDQDDRRDGQDHPQDRPEQQDHRVAGAGPAGSRGASSAPWASATGT